MLSFAKGGDFPVKSAEDDALRKLKDLSIVGQNAIQMLGKLPRQSPHRRPLLSYLARHLRPSSRAAALLGVSSSAVDKAVSPTFEPEKAPLFSQRYPPGTHKQKTPTATTTVIEQFIKDSCPPKSGTAREHYQQKVPSNDLYADFVSAWPALAMRVAAAAPSDEAAYQTIRKKAQASAGVFAFLQICRTPAAGASQPLYTSFVCRDTFDPHLLDLIVSFVCPFPVRPPSRTLFDKIKAGLPLSRVQRYHGEFDCKTCSTLATDEAKLKQLNARCFDLSAGELAEHERLQAAVEGGRRHHAVHLHQAASLRRSLSALAAGEASIQLDFGSLNRRPNVSDKDKALIPTLMMVVHSRAALGGDLERNYIAWLCQDRATAKSRFHFYRACLLALLTSPWAARLISLTLWSDTAAKDFRSRYAQRLEAELRHLTGIDILRCFTAARHGRSLCDAMLGLLSQLLNRALLKAEALRIQAKSRATDDVLQLDEAAKSLKPNADTQDAATLTHDQIAKLMTPFCSPLDLLPLFRRVRKLTAVVLPQIDSRDSLKPTLSPLKGIMGMHSLKYEALARVQMRERTGDELCVSAAWSSKDGADKLLCFPNPLKLACPPWSALAAHWQKLGVTWQLCDSARPLAVQGPLTVSLPSVASLPSAVPAPSASPSAQPRARSRGRKRKTKAADGDGDAEWRPDSKQNTPVEPVAKSQRKQRSHSKPPRWQNEEQDEIDEDFPPKEVLEWFFADYDGQAS